jgi:D-arabinose 1-dehydrogenase-like Zn-dependent alcohol dehydrogenase
MTKMRVAQIARPGGPFEIVEREIPEPGAGSVRIKVQACGICHSDSLVKEGHWPGLQYPRVPRHEVIGVVDAVGAGVAAWKPGQRVGMGWHGGHCGYCDACRRGDFFGCQVALQITGISFDGGYADYMTAPAIALALVPEDLTALEAAPLMRAGITTYNALRNSNARPGDVVAIQGLGGLGHLGVQYAVKMGFKTVGIARGKDKEPLPQKLGAQHYIDSQAQDPAAELQKLGGAKVILATVTNGDAMSAVQGRFGNQRNIDRHRRGGVAASLAAAAYRRSPLDQRLVFRHSDGFAGNSRLQHDQRRPLHERSLPAETRGRSL